MVELTHNTLDFVMKRFAKSGFAKYFQKTEAKSVTVSHLVVQVNLLARFNKNDLTCLG